MVASSTCREVILADEIRQGNVSAFMELFETFHHPLYLHVLSFAKSEELAKDIVQETFVRVWERREDLNPGLSLKSYLFTICKNLTLNHLKKAAREKGFQKEWLYVSPAEDTSGEDGLAYREYEEMAMEAISHLPPKRQAIFRMSRLEGKDHDEISATLGVSKNTVRDHLAKATKSLKNFLSLHSDLSLVFLILPALFPLLA